MRLPLLCMRLPLRPRHHAPVRGLSILAILAIPALIGWRWRKDVTLTKEVNKEGAMAIFLIKCPHAHRPISTGMRLKGAGNFCSGLSRCFTPLRDNALAPPAEESS